MKHTGRHQSLAGRKILFANAPADGHFNPLTGLAMYLKELGCDVRWYSAHEYAERINRLQIHHYPYKKAREITGTNLGTMLPGRDKIKNPIKKLNLDMKEFFILRSVEYYEDILDINENFDFDLMISDNCFSAIPFVRDKMKKEVIAIGVLPLTETSRDLPPSGLGLTPSYSLLGKLKQSVLRYLAANVLFKASNKMMQNLLASHGIHHNNLSVFDILVHKSTLLLQSGTPGIEYRRSDMSKNVRFIGALLPYSSKKQQLPWFDERLKQYSRIAVLTQGTVEKDVTKLLVPALEAFKNTDTLVICTTGGSQTAGLKQAYPQSNLIIEDFIPFADIMPYAHVYITNGGYGGVMLGIQNKLPLVVAGVHEGKNEICARVGYFKLGVNLKTETPSPVQIRQAVDQVLENTLYRKNVEALAREFAMFRPQELVAGYVAETIQPTHKVTYDHLLSMASA
jgi:UDP-glucoronosyl and UDP-glucosyl transferase.